ncbi:MAG: acyltransferase family protein, partial [Anaerolineales bacterium]
DALRGLIILLMALDHANHFIAQSHSSGEYWGGFFPTYTQILPFLTRFVTHICAPGFSFVLGIGMILLAESRRRQGWSAGKIRRFLITRGLVLIALQFIIVNRAWEWSPSGWQIETYVGVLFALGGGLIIGSFLIGLPRGWFLALSLATMLFFEWLTPSPEMWGQFQVLGVPDRLNWWLLRTGGDQVLWSNYPLLQWLEFTFFGMFFGSWILEQGRKPLLWAWKIGLALLLGFVIIRAADGFGNIRPRPGNSWIDWLNVVKYPPSISFSLLTMGINLLLLSGLERLTQLRPAWTRLFVWLGQAPLFFYVTHLFLYAAIGNWLTPSGTTLGQMYLWWLAGVAVLLPLTRWFGQFKRTRPVNSMIRLL